ncbi:hybrid sensor histidine kinase/response regulator [Paracoccus luteus]|uniref:hybrid sensor histidine kinase/response regulator n=1 Tax=Paracoccus luteus TaxID=2508543 RepID=UPI001FE6929A|nr:PAS domain-containing sensor histidine kinase [Paracoccus luteus]
MTERTNIPARGVALLPLLMLPVAIGAVMLAVLPGHPPGRWMVIAGSVACGWYLLGGMLSLRQLSIILQRRRDLNRAVRSLPAAGLAWVVAPDGRIHAQTDDAHASLDVVGAEVGALVARFTATPDRVASSMLARAHERRPAALDLAAGGRIEARRIGGSAAQIWQLTPADTPAEPAIPAPAAHGADFARLPVALMELDAQGLVTTANDAAIALLGPVAPGMPLGDLLDGPGRPLADWVAEVREGRDIGRGEVLRCKAEGRENHVQVTLAADARTGGAVAVLTDASAIKTLEAQFVQSQKMQAIGQLAGGIAHDFNNLLTAITGHCDLLMLRRDKTDPDYADLHQISQNANRAAALVEQLLAFSRKQTLKPQILDLRDTLSDLTHLLNRLVGERVLLTFTNDPALRPIRADKRQLEQVLMNLVVNARDAMPGGGEIVIRTDNVRLGAAQAMDRASLPRGDYVRVTVSDEGCGIAPDQIDKIFDPFFTTKRQGEGTGLGLSTVYGIVKQTGGFIFCDSTVGEGTTFTLFFPSQKREAMATPDPVPAPQPVVQDPTLQDRQRSVLLVEDEGAVRAFAARALRLRGFEVVEADCAERALDLLKDDRLAVDLFVTDVVMPGMDGPTWVRAALRDRPGTKVIFVSGYSEVTLSDASSPIPGALFLPKPFSLSELIASVENHLAGLPGPAVPAETAAVG